MKKGDHVFYISSGNLRIRGMVDRVHRDGSLTIEARFAVDDAGQDRAGFLGYKYRMAADLVRPLSELAS